MAFMSMHRALDIHLYGHSSALLMLLAGIWFDSVWLVRVGAATGAPGAGAYAVFSSTSGTGCARCCKKRGCRAAPNRLRIAASALIWYSDTIILHDELFKTDQPRTA
jgi:hypothetical protein